MKQERVQKSKKIEREEDPPQTLKSKSKSGSLASDLDDVLDEIDSVLEENAEEFVNAYVQHGGE